MRWTIRIFLLVLAGCVIYLSSALVSLARLAEAARAADGAAVIARTDIPRVRHSIVSQLITAYLDKVGKKRPVGAFERIAVGTFGASIADDLATKLITADNLSAILQYGAVADNSARLEFTGMPALADLDHSNVIDVLQRVRFIKPVELEIRLGPDRSAGSISLHFEGTGWKLSAINLPAPIVTKLLDRLPTR